MTLDNQEFQDLFEEVCNSNLTNINEFIKILISDFNEGSDSVQVLEELPFDTDKEVVDRFFNFHQTENKFVETVMAQVGNKTIISEGTIPFVAKMRLKPYEGDSDDYHGSKCGRSSIALNVESPSSILKEISTDKDWTIVYRLVMNETLDSDVLHSLAVDLDLEDDVVNEEILATIALHRNSSYETLQLLSAHSSENVRSAILINQNCTRDLMKVLRASSIPEMPIFESSYCWWDTPTSNWANCSDSLLEELGILGFGTE